MLTPIFSPICLDHIPADKTIYSHSIFFPFTTTPSTFLFFIRIFSTGDSSNIFTPSFLAAFANNCVIPDGSPDPSPGIKIPPIKSLLLINGILSFICFLLRICTSKLYSCAVVACLLNSCHLPSS